MQKKYKLRANNRFKANICLSFSHTGEYLLQNIRLEENFKRISHSMARAYICPTFKLSYFQMHPKATMAVLTLNFFL
jgi:hypothetical protein